MKAVNFKRVKKIWGIVLTTNQKYQNRSPKIPLPT
jgi:hypothetical protein